MAGKCVIWIYKNNRRYILIELALDEMKELRKDEMMNLDGGWSLGEFSVGSISVAILCLGMSLGGGYMIEDSLNH